MPELTGPVQQVVLSNTLWTVPLLPLAGAVLNALFGRKLQTSSFGATRAQKWHIGSLGVTAVATTAILLAFASSLVHVAELASNPAPSRYLYWHGWQMVRVGSVSFDFDLALDPLSAVLILIITGVGALIHIYSAAYMADDPGYWRFFTYLNLFVFSMLLLVLGDGFVVMFFGWEGVGLCSYLLIGFWYQDYAKANAGMKAFVANRIGDWGFIVGLLVLFWGLGGSWLQGGFFQPDNLARLALVGVSANPDLEPDSSAPPALSAHGHAEGHRPADVRVRSSADPKVGPGFLSLTAFPGARVFVDGSGAPLATSPFVNLPIAAGHHTIKVEPGLGMDEQEIPAASIEPGAHTVLTVVGPALAFRQIHDQLVVKDAHDDFTLRAALQSKTVWGGISLITLACFGFFVGAAGKSAQIPLYVWLPDAMAGPTPVSALIHAATMVTAGVYMVARLSWLFALSSTASAIVAGIGAMTALFAATIGLFQYDIKKILAYSTVSQLGFMFVGVGVGAYWAAVFHLLTHAFFKACLFLGSGSVIHGMHCVEHQADRAQDIRLMGGLRRVMPITARTYWVACAAISAAPIPLFAGFWSKDEILWRALNTENIGATPALLIYTLALAAALCTSFYMWRSYFLTFEGPHANPTIAEHVHESPAVMTYVLAILAALSMIVGALLGCSRHFIGDEHAEPLLERWLRPVFSHTEVHFAERGLGVEFALMAVSVAFAVVAFLVARARYGTTRPLDWQKRESKLPLFEAIQNKYWVDEVYEATFIAWTLRLRLVLADMDRWVVDGIVNGSGVAARAAAWVTGAIDRNVVDGMVNALAEVTLTAGARLRTMQTGRVQSYVYGLLGGVAFLALLRYFLAK